MSQRLDLNFIARPFIFPPRLCRIASLFIIGFMVFSALCGRFFERSFPALIAYIPLFGVLVGVGLMLAMFSCFRTAFPHQSTMKLWGYLLVAHFIAFAVLGGVGALCVQARIEMVHFFISAALASFVFWSRIGNSVASSAPVSAIFVVLLCTGEEFLQQLVPDRIFDPRDIAYNIIGGAIGLGYAVLLISIAERFLIPHPSLPPAPAPVS